MNPQLDLTTATVLSWAALALLVVVALAVLAFAGRFLLKLAVVGIVLVLAVAVWDQRASLADCPRTCACSFFGQDISLGDGAAAQACEQVAGRVAGLVG